MRPGATQVGDRVELVFTPDPFTRLRPGDRGTVTKVDRAGITHISWDNGSGLALLCGLDDWRIITEGRHERFSV